MSRQSNSFIVFVPLTLMLGALGACESALTPTPHDPDDPSLDQSRSAPATYGPGTPVALQTAMLESAVDAQRAALRVNDGLDADALLVKRGVEYEDELGYQPSAAKLLDLIQGSSLSLDDKELALLEQRGFAIAERHEFPSFGYGYATLYAEDLPVYVTLDSVLEAVHRSYDDILKRLEEQALVPELGRLLSAMRSNLSTRPPPGMSAENQRDAELYLTVAETLLGQGASLAELGVDPLEVANLVGKAEAADGTDDIVLFGTKRTEDFSQFKPRGHYTDSATLSRYFRAMMWLGRVDCRMIETDELGQLIFRRRQVEAAVALGLLVDTDQQARWQGIDSVISAFIGEHDSMQVPEVPKLLQALGVSDLEGLMALPDERIAQALLDGGYGAQRIASSIMVSGLSEGTLPLNRSFLLFGQRYVLDSHVFSNLVFDRLNSANHPMRMMPNPLDVAYAALGNDDAIPLLHQEIDHYGYASQLEDMRSLADGHGDDYWEMNLYNLWLSALRGASAGPARAADPDAKLPSVTRSEGWARRMLNTQLASWAELRHDTILYVKQSYTTSAICEFPDAYVDPYPEAWAALERFAKAGQELSNGLLAMTAPDLRASTSEYFASLEQTVRTLREMASAEIDGTPFSPAQMAFIQSTVATDGVCGSTAVTGWYGTLHIDPERSGEYDPVIADVHTQPTDEGGSPVGHVLHVGVGRPRLMVVTANTCNGPRAYAGLVSAYFEHITDNFERLTDPEWQDRLDTHPPAEVPWMTDLVAQKLQN
jgi:hypothetical protein